MNIKFISLHPGFITSYQNLGIFLSAKEIGAATFESINLRDFAKDKHKSVDGPPFGGGDGMILKPDVLASAVQSIDNPFIITSSPSGKAFDQDDALELLEVGKSGKCLTFVCGRFAGFDARFTDLYVDKEYSLGDFVISGGELACLTICDAMLRFVPGVLGNPTSSQRDSFSEEFGGGLEHPLYTKPRNFEGRSVPEVLLSGNHRLIEKWRTENAIKHTLDKRPDLIK